MAFGLDVQNGLVGTTLTADQFSTVTFTRNIDPNTGQPYAGTDFQVSPEVAGFVTWRDETGEPWTQGGQAGPLTYTVTAASDPNQVVTFQVTGPSLAQPLTIYGKVLGWSTDTILFQGFLGYDSTTGTLSQPLPGKSSYFAAADRSLVPTGGIPVPTSSFFQAQSGPFFLNTFQVANPCFARGTRLATPSGPVAVEDLAVGGEVLTQSGATARVQWIGRSLVRVDQHPQPGRVAPVRVAQDAFGPAVPARDLLLSPEHAVFHADALIPVQCLVNGTTIRQEPVAGVEYFHVELPRHDVVMAEGLPAESYLDTGNRRALETQDAAA